MQWSTFPMHQGRLARLQSLVKVLLRSFFFGGRVWIKNYPAPLPYWLGVRRRYLRMKVRDREFSPILYRIEQER